METFTYTFSESVENHTGMQQIGLQSNIGFSLETLNRISNYMTTTKGVNCELIHLNQYLPVGVVSDKEAYILVIKNGLSILGNKNDLTNEITQQKLIVDKKAYMKGHVVNKHARWNLCYADHEQEPDYENKKGRIISFTNSPQINKVRKALASEELLGEMFYAELNYYYDITKTGIGFHGDTERKKVIGLRLGASLPLHYQWFKNSKPIGTRAIIQLNDGDVYIMSDKAVGYDWLKKNTVTLRHATGCEKFTTIN